VELYRYIRDIVKYRTEAGIIFTEDSQAAEEITMMFKGKNAVVTGGAGGIGLQVARQLLLAGVGVR